MNDFETKRTDYLNNTHTLNNYNEILNVNNQLKFNYDSDKEKLDQTNNLLKSRILKMKQDYVLNDYALNKYNSLINLLYIVTIFFCILGLLFIGFIKGNYNRKILIYLSSALFLILLSYVLYYFLDEKTRRKISSNQYYWDKINYDLST